MKLKKIASLALAGIMAVSMLTACGEGGKKEEEGSSSSEITTVNGAAEALNAALSRNKDVIKFENDDTLNKNLEAYFALNPIMGDEWNSKKYDEGNITGNSLKTAIGADDIGKTYLGQYITDTKNNGGHDGKTVAWVSMYNTAVYSEADALKTVGKVIDQYDFVEDKSNAKDDGKMYDFSGAASVLEVKSAKGGASAWVVVVTITKDYAKV